MQMGPFALGARLRECQSASGWRGDRRSKDEHYVRANCDIETALSGAPTEACWPA
jgi:hypothetical protein